jgi:hypothetical protein
MIGRRENNGGRFTSNAGGTARRRERGRRRGRESLLFLSLLIEGIPQSLLLLVCLF